MGQWRGTMIADDLKDMEMDVLVHYRSRRWYGRIINPSDSVETWAAKKMLGSDSDRTCETTIGDIFLTNIQTRASERTIIKFRGAGPRRGNVALTM